MPVQSLWVRVTSRPSAAYGRSVIPLVTLVRMSGARHRDELPVLVLGPSLGTSATVLWLSCASGLADAFDVVAWDLPGHGHNQAVPEEPVTTAELATGVLGAVDDLLTQRGEPRAGFWYAGASVGGAVGLELLLAAPDRVAAAALLGTAARAWAPERRTDRAASDDGYARVCDALAGFDVGDRLGRIAVPVLAVAGADDTVTPPAGLREIADGVRDGRYAELAGVGHLAPSEAPAEVALLLREHFLGEVPVAPGLGDVDALLREAAAVDVWSRPGLGRRERWIVAIAALAADGRQDALAATLREASADGLGVAEVREVLLQLAVHLGAPVARAALRTAEQVLAEDGPPRP